VTAMELTGVWLSEYEFESTGRGAIFAGRHYVTARRIGERLRLQSVPASKSRLTMDLEVRDREGTAGVLLGMWLEETDPAGYYQGKPFYGTLLAIVAPDGRAASGRWTGASHNELAVNTGPWRLTKVEENSSPEAVDRWNREPEEPAAG
jgi:hypothetical protein